MTASTTMGTTPPEIFASSTMPPRPETRATTWSPRMAWARMSLGVRKSLFRWSTTILRKVTPPPAWSKWKKTAVYDIVDAGPNHRFAILGEGGNVRLAHNCDYSSQESFIAAALSGDKKLMAAYTGGDPYLAFAISAGAAPAGATKKTHGDVRQLFKATVLGLQYGMGAAKLAVKLTADTGKKVSEDQARELIQMHREVYSQYYSWKDGVWARYRDGSKPMLLADGWYLDTDCTSKMSALNFPVQGGGSAMMRHFIDILLDKGVRVVCPVHDSVIYMSEVGDTATHSVVAGAMIEASRRVLGVEGMRVGAPDTLRHGEFWETEKNAETLSRFKKFFEPKEELEGGWLARVCAEE